MPQGRDPVQARAGESVDLYDISTWEVRTRLDRLAVGVYGGVISTGRAVVIGLAIVILVGELALGGLGALAHPIAGALTVLSAIPALVLAAYVRLTDVTTEPLDLLVGTFALGVLFAGFAGVLNSLAGPVLRSIPGIGVLLMFYLVVGPVEETVKVLAVRIWAYRSDRFTAVVDGAVYGAAAGLGFATIENAMYITQTLDAGVSAANVIGAGGGIAAIRALAGPGHVIYSAFAGYYLGLAKFNPDQAGPIVVKGVLLAALIHGTYNTLVSFVPDLVAVALGVSPLAAFFGFVVVYDTVFGYLLFRKIARYRALYGSLRSAAERDESSLVAERTEFDA